MNANHVVINGDHQRRVLITALVISFLLTALPLQAKEVVIYNLSNGAENPESILIADSTGVLYGTATGGGPANAGVVFSLTPPAEGQTNWTETDIYQFQGGSDGSFPIAGLTPDGSGGYYGTTFYGGEGLCIESAGCGIIFHLMPPAGGQTNWTETVLYRFQGPDGAQPGNRLMLDNATGTLYGTTFAGGASNAGEVFRLTPPAQGQTSWTESVLYSFTGGADGGYPFAYVIADENGALYSTTTAGGFTGNGTVFKLTPPAEGQTSWTEVVLHSFMGFGFDDGGAPNAGLAVDASGNFYSTTVAGGFLDYGTVFELSPPSGGGTSWTETVLYAFGGGKDGALAESDIIMDRNGVIYGTTGAGGASNKGTVFKLTPPGSGQTNWAERRLCSLNGSDGTYPIGGLIAQKVGKKVVLFGDTFAGGNGSVGVLYEITGSGFFP